MLKKVIFFLFIFISVNVNAGNELRIGDIPPNYLGRDSTGNKINLEDNKGKVVVVSFWASWCSPCLRELPILENIQNKIGIDKINVVAINFKEDRKQYRKIKAKLSDLKLTLTHDKRGVIGKKYGVKAVPHLFIIDKEGKLAFQNIGYGDSSIDKLVQVLNKQF
ncbi:TlpA family protein disulfide reductase [Pseudoalteromonas denitrificans]|uniref:Peroxiredoxin n=1 Tax=Pseudoalteromonas denitrificans DSM 6059 TaxID=1123010 RepID=A0A1I1U433_9GAMM|nr:TlpA disulfide reductase family protein [Pseudoalteromonas denitrificans]SFD65557.1 Peroxiredoxin [Pseudoalteromonas denitrificans DSM 6059]